MIQPTKFDELTKVLANSTSRRHALRTIVTASVGSLVGLGGIRSVFGGGGNSACAHWCAQVFGPNTRAAGKCTSDAAHNKGPCKTCGSFSPSDICCTKTTPSGPCTGGIVAGCTCSGSCGTCNYSNGTCPSSCSGSTPNCCSNSCTNTLTDSNNCGACGTVCGAGATCQSGTCVQNCTSIGGMCNDIGDCCPGLDCQGFNNICCIPTGGSVPGGCLDVSEPKCCSGLCNPETGGCFET